MPSLSRVLAALLLCSVFVAQASGQAKITYPMLMSLHPVAAQVGQTSEHEVSARYNLYGAYQVLVTGTGVTGEIVADEKKAEPGKKPTVNKMKIRFTVAPDAQPGVRDVRIATPQGVSTLAQLVIVRDPVVVEEKANDTAEQAQAITVPATVCGTIEKAEDVDFYRFSVSAGTALSFHVQSGRLQDKIHDLQQHADPILTLRSANGSTLAASDNYYFADPFLRYRFEHDGEYLLEIRDVRYQGNAEWRYSIEISDRPFVTNVFPLGISRGEESKVELVGFQLPEVPVSTVSLPAEVPEGPMVVGVPMGDSVTNPVPVYASSLPAVIESAEDNNTIETAQTITFPAGISGRIEREADVDYYAFEAKKGEAFSFEVVARRLQSELDSNLRILNDKGAPLTENDDARVGRLTYADSWIENWKAPADGKYFLEIRDLHLRGGAEYTYYVRATAAQPYFTLTLDTDKTLLAPGTGGVIFARVERKNGFTGEIQLAVEGLLPGVTASCGRILADGQDGCILLEAASDAPMGVANLRVTGTATWTPPEGGEPIELTATAVPLQEIYFPGGGRGHFPVEMHTLSVNEPMDLLKVEISEDAVTLKPGESKTIDITITRAEGFDQNVTLDLLYRHLGGVFGDSLPKGVTIDEKSSKTLLTKGESKGSITLKAAADAKPVSDQQVAVMANVSVNFVMKMTYAARPLRVSVAAP